MSSLRNVQEIRGGWFRLASFAIIGAFLVVGTQGCCSWMCPPPQITHTIALVENIAEQSCANPTCVCPVPVVTSPVRQGDQIQFVNTSPYKVTLDPSVDDAVTEGTGPITGVITVDAKKTEFITVVASSGGVSFDMTVASPGVVCPGLPGPRIDID